MDLHQSLQHLIATLDSPPPDATRPTKKNYTEKISQDLTDLIAVSLQALGLRGIQAPRGRDKQFMGGYGTKGVDAYLSDEKHGLLLSSGTKGILYDVPKNLKNRYRDIVMEALELHKRFPYAVCGHLIFLARSEAERPSRAFGTVLGEAALLLSGITGRRRPEEAAEVYETIGVLLFDPGKPDSLDLSPAGLPEDLWAASYCERLVAAFKLRNPFFQI